jgi:hypothetical protein
MTVTAESLREIWAAIFRRKGRDGTYTRLFDNLDPLQQSTLLAKFKLRESELPVIGSVPESGNWLLLTTQRLIWSIVGERHEVAAEAIRDAKADYAQLQRCEHSKLRMLQLQVVTMGDGIYPIELEPGAPLSGTWSVLKHLGRRNRRPTSDGKTTPRRD